MWLRNTPRMRHWSSRQMCPQSITSHLDNGVYVQMYMNVCVNVYDTQRQEGEQCLTAFQ